MKKLQVVLGKTTLLACVLAVTAGGCSKDKTSEKSGNESGGAAGESDVGGNAGSGGDSGGESSNGRTSGGKSSAGGTSSATSSSENGGGTAGSAGSSGTGGATAGVTALSVKTEQTSLRGLVEQTLTLDVTIDRGDESAKGDVTVSAQGLPAGVGSSPVKIATGNNKAQLQIKIGPTAQVGGPYAFSVIATSGDDSSVSTTVPMVLYVTQKAGALDISFGNAGTAKVTPMLGSEETATPKSIAVDSKGRVVVGGTGTSKGWVVRLTSNGTLDTTFAKTGALSDFGLPSSSVYGVALSNEQLYVAASQRTSESSVSYYLRKITETGTTDPAFNSGVDVTRTSSSIPFTAFKNEVLVANPLTPIQATGAVDTSFTAPSELSVYRLAVDSQDRILYASRSLKFYNSGSFGRLLSTGEADSHFGTNGIVDYSCATSGESRQAASVISVLPTPDLGMVALMNCTTDSRDIFNSQASLVALSLTGAPMRSFGDNGRRVVADLGTGSDAVVQLDGKVVVLYSKNSKDGSDYVYDYALSRYDSTGAIDSSFGDSGTFKLGLVRGAFQAIIYPKMAYDASAQRVVVALPVSDSTSFEIRRFWL